MRYFRFNTDGSSEEIANIVVQQLEINNEENQFDVQQIEDTYDIDGMRMIIVTINEIDFDTEESFIHEIKVHEIDIHEYKTDLHLTY